MTISCPSLRVPVAVAVLVGVGCESADDVAHKRKLEALVQRVASRTEVAGALGPGYRMYTQGTPSWADLQAFLKREPSSDLRPLRDGATKYPSIMYYTTAWRMTWIFFDEHDRIRGYYLTAQ